MKNVIVETALSKPDPRRPKSRWIKLNGIRVGWVYSAGPGLYKIEFDRRVTSQGSPKRNFRGQTEAFNALIGLMRKLDEKGRLRKKVF